MSHSYTLSLPVWYRGTDETEWHTGLSRIVSPTGALICADEPGVPSQELIVAIGFPSFASCLLGRGRVIRLVSAEDDTAPLTFAVQVSRYRLKQSLTRVLRALATSV